ncbi:class I SAM-dependent methyltransferase [Novosphingobium resinovorum]|uniref:Ubiquinone biosynthesis protein UbiE n=2 Tax=Novosphingobium TaxID=165696 RepID=A0A1D8A9E0_9SPHN|nr:class I SAM-dependent methyltransferase [Novosphingobium resinovorum]AOR78747.1 ubiquinone biosynthesis protein UbiE [Novosphingobium resinovorum]MBF7010349.1 class I SAM-dependent methyltransferase [Novosphingobium sp. HR1a]WJM28354.1 class I SAM-dependent methyltransferase [Novosphingobium resinovorum]
MREFENPDHWDAAARHYEKTAHPFTARYAEAAVARISLGSDSHVLDIAAGTGALALAAARTGAKVLATDFSPGMVARIAATGHPNVEAKTMDGQNLALPDGGFDAVFSIFGVIMFPDWRKGLAEMARVTRPGGHGIVATWQQRGAATFLLLGDIRRKLFPGRDGMAMPEAVGVLSDPGNFAREMILAGYRDPRIEPVTHDYELDVGALDDPDTLFGMSPDWTSLNDGEKAEVITEVRQMAGERSVLPIPSTALIVVAQR